MGTAKAAHGQGRYRAILLVPVALCLAILWQTQQLYGSCRAPTHVQDVETLKTYLLETSQAVGKRSQDAAAAMQQLAADIADSGPKAQSTLQQLNETKGQLQTCKDNTLKLTTEITSLKEKANSHAEQLQQKQDAAKKTEQASQSAEAELQKVQEQLKQTEEQMKKMEAELKQQQTTKPGEQQAQAAGPVSADAVAARLHALETAGLQCNVIKDQELWADPLVWGFDHRAQDAAECCAACHAYNTAIERGGMAQGRNSTRCNTWAFCADKEACKERYRECWIKNQKKDLPLPPALPPDAHAVKGWVSGTIYPDDVLFKKQEGSSHLVMHTALGDITIQLLPELAPASVREIQRMAKLQTNGLSSCRNCRMYRPEPNFLVQGLLEAPGSYVAVPRHPSPAQPLVMPRGMLCWAGGSGGPHWFVNLVDQSGFKDEHLCWGQVDSKDMALFDKIVTLPKKNKKPGEMNELVEHIRYKISLKGQDSEQG